MANELEQRARQLLSARLESAGQQPIAGDVFYGREHPAMTVAIRTLAAALQQAQQPSEQPPSIPEPSGEDVSASGAAYSVALSNYGTRLRGKSAHEVATLAALTTYTARLRERIGTPTAPLPEGVSEEDAKAAIAARNASLNKHPGDAVIGMRAALESYRARLAAKGGV